MSGDDQSTPPPVVWAQRSNRILLTVCLHDCKKPVVELFNDKVYFKGLGGTDKKIHEVTINLYKEINPEKSFHFVRDRVVELVLMKKDEGPYWPHLTKEKVKYHWLKVDFNKWVDENDSEGEDEKYKLPDDSILDLKPNIFEDDLDSEEWDGNEGADSDDSDLPNLD